MRKLENKVVFITGASKGIGLGCALSCLKHGARVATFSLSADDIHAQVEQAGFAADSLLAMEGDVRDAVALEGSITRAVEHFGQLDGLVNNAGWHPPAMSIEETSLEDFEGLIRLNLTSAFLGCKYAIPHLKKTRGAIVTMSSEVGLIGQGDAVSYVTTKAAQLGMTKALALDFAPFGVRVNAICPAGVMTPLMREWADSQYDPVQALATVDAWHPLGRMATIGEMGEVCAFLLSAEASFMTGQTICPDGGAALGYRHG